MAPVFSGAEIEVILLSLKVSTMCTLVNLVPGVITGYVLGRYRFRGRQLINALVHLPLVLPPVVVGLILIELFGSRGPIGKILAGMAINIIFTWKAAVLAAAIMGFPLVVRSVRTAFELVDRRLEEAAATLGAGPFKVFFTVTLPLSLPGIIAGTLLSFARSLGEFGATITFSGNIIGETRTLPLAIYTYIQLPDGGSAAARLALLSVLISVLAVLLSEYLSEKVLAQRGVHNA
ncbi:MAG: molybdate ABC transporter permease subunit [Candidatus Wallbacteria bacterium]|nr:molybdate ABC transporter permease subunit [Candidatus Wallbacteria bacterium]